jgi:hypothetical protein
MQSNMRCVAAAKVRQQMSRSYREARASGFTVLWADEAMAGVRKAHGGRVWVFCQTLEFYELEFPAVAIRSCWAGNILLRLTGLNDIQHSQGLPKASLTNWWTRI